MGESHNYQAFLTGVREIGRQSIVFIALWVLLQFACVKAWAGPTTPYQAEQVVAGWLASDTHPLGTAIGTHVTKTEIFTDDNGEPIYYVVYLWPSGFVIVSADESDEPIIGFADDGTYDCSPADPLGALVSRDLRGRAASRKAHSRPHLEAPFGRVGLAPPFSPQRKWTRFIRLAETSEDELVLTSMPSVSDVRIAPLLQSKWAQGDVCEQHCFNYYTPDYYACGCVATAMAQLMRYHQHPQAGIGVRSFAIQVMGRPQTASTRGGNGSGGPYYWSDMTLVPDCQTTGTQRAAIGTLCYDAGIAVNVDYGPDGSSSDVLKARNALINVFRYSNLVEGYNRDGDIGPDLLTMINPNLDSGHPVILGVWHEESGHAVLCDGYGYSAATLYHHLNMGWAGVDDAWYNLPNIDASSSFTSVAVCLYNIFASGTGEIISGRITDISGKPISEVAVIAASGGSVYTATTNAQGIYAMAKIPSAATYTVGAAKIGYLFGEQTVTTGRSRDRSGTSGNRWQIDLAGTVAPDLDGDGQVNTVDFAIFASAWLTAAGDAGWNPYCDISSPADNFIDTLDLVVFADNWLVGIK
jgi:hypothetical protein